MQKKSNFTWYIIGLIGIFIVLFFLAGRGGSEGNSSNNNLTITSDEWIKGGKNASVTLVEYSDFQCPACRSYVPVVQQLNETFGDQLRIVYRHFPLTQIHPNAFGAAQAAEAAGLQDKFWEMHDLIFERQGEWSAALRGSEAFFNTYAEEIGIDLDQFKSDYNSDTVRQNVSDDVSAGNALNLSGTPSFTLEGKKIQSPRSFDEFRALVEAAVKDAPAPEVNPDDIANAKDVHEHADFAVYLSGNKFDFSADKYQSDEPDDEQNHEHEEDHTNALDPYVHIHNKKGDIIHKHKQGITLGYFFETLGMEFNDDCFGLDDGSKYCSDDSNSLKFFVNGARSAKAGSYEFSDLDQILISYGPLTDSSLQAQLDSVSDEACIYSKTCPERGEAPEEKCVGGIGTDCIQ